MFGFGRTAELEEEIRIKDLYITTLEKKISSKSRKKRRKELSHKTGFTRVGKVESLDMYDMYQDGMEVSNISNQLNRSHSCVSKHIRKHLEE